MKDTIIKNTGNSRFLRSSVAEDITFAEFIALLRAGQLPIDLAGINEDGVEILGTALSKSNLLRDASETFLFGNAEDRTIDETFLRLAPWTLIDTIDNTVGYSGTWTAPDIFGDGSAYDLGVYMIGGGGSGGVAIGTSDYYSRGGGGASGYGKNIVIENVAPGSAFSWVLGVGGTSVSATTSSYSGKIGTNGGTTTFNGNTATGGSGGNYNIGTNHASGANGGQGSDATSAGLSPREIWGCVGTGTNGGLSQSARVGQNCFDPTMITLCAGGYANYSTPQTILAMPDGTKGGNGVCKSNANATGQTATGYGNGGGGASSYSISASRTVKSGAGSDGAIFLYARKAVS